MICSFSGKYFFLSNFAELPGGKTVEHYFQASKTHKYTQSTWILEAETPSKAKYRGRLVELRPDWEQVKIGIMKDLLRKKFQFEEFREQLLATGDEQLVEGNSWGDTFWGVCRGKGCNWLGKLLMEVREEIRKETGELPDPG